MPESLYTNYQYSRQKNRFIKEPGIVPTIFTGSTSAFTEEDLMVLGNWNRTDLADCEFCINTNDHRLFLRSDNRILEIPTSTGGTFDGLFWSADSGTYSIVNKFGDNIASGILSLATGSNSQARGQYSFAANNSVADGDLSASFNQSSSYGNNSFSIGGEQGTASGTSCFAGANGYAAGDECFAFGTGSKALIVSSVAFAGGIAEAPYSFCFGNSAKAIGEGAGFCFSNSEGGDPSYATSQNCFVMGLSCTGGSLNSIVTGKLNKIGSFGESGAIIGGENNVLNTSLSVILGGRNISGTSTETVYVPHLNINYTPELGTSLDKVLVRASNGDVKMVDPSEAQFKNIVLNFGCNSYDPADSTTYVIGNLVVLPPQTLFNNRPSRQVICPSAGVVKSVQVMSAVAGTLASSADITITIYNVTTATGSTVVSDYKLSSGVLTGQSRLDNYDLVTPLTVNANDKLQIRVTYPAFVTNPTQVYQTFQAYIV